MDGGPAGVLSLLSHRHCGHDHVQLQHSARRATSVAAPAFGCCYFKLFEIAGGLAAVGVVLARLVRSGRVAGRLRGGGGQPLALHVPRQASHHPFQ